MGLNHYQFHYDLSRTNFVRNLILPYFIALNDLHNLPVPAEVYRGFFREDWLTKKLPLNMFDPNNFTYHWIDGMDQKAIDATPMNLWTGRYYPETRDEYIKILDDCLMFCESNNIRPIIIRTPVTEKFITMCDKRLADEFSVFIEHTLQKHPYALFVDGWKLKDFTFADFKDHVHMNRTGAAKFSTYLNEYIEKLDFSFYKNVNNFCNHLKDFTEEIDRSLYNRFGTKGW